MLPEKKKKLIIIAISIVLFILLVLIIWGISSFIKNINSEDVFKDDYYLSNYIYYGVSKDEDEMYHIYGILDNEEINLEINTFFPIKDFKIINKHVLYYSNALNEIRYDKKKKEYYEYEVDTFFNKDYTVLLTNEYVFYIDDNSLYYFNKDNNHEKSTLLKENIQKQSMLYDKNTLYYVKDDGIYKYDFNIDEEKLLIEINEEYTYKLLGINENYLYYLENNEITALSILNETSTQFKELGNISFISKTEDGFLYFNKEEKTINSYSIMYNRIKNYEVKFDADEMVFYEELSDNYVFIKVKNGELIKSIIIDVDSKETRELINDYEYLVRVN